MRALVQRAPSPIAMCARARARRSFASGGAEYRGPGGLSASELFAKVQEASRRDAASTTPSDADTREAAPKVPDASPDASKLSVKELIALLKPHVRKEELAGIKEKDELVRRVERIRSQSHRR